jgi:putative SOS response-associated peptidase YedK
MYVRYRLSAKERYLRDHFGIEEEVSWQPRWNIAPAQKVSIVRQNRKEPKRTFGLVRWGLIPSWTLLANSRSLGERFEPPTPWPRSIPALVETC